MQWLPARPALASPPTTFAAACSDGTFKITRAEADSKIRRGAQRRDDGRSMNGDGTAILTVGEDGAVKSESRGPPPRHPEQREAAVYCVVVVLSAGAGRKDSTSNPRARK